MTKRNLDDLWARMASGGDSTARDQLIQSHLGLVYQTAKKMARHIAEQVELADLVSSGTVGLIQAIDNFDGGRGVTFSTYAVSRIRGAIIDDLRSRDEASRSLRRKEREMDRVRMRLEQDLGRAPADKEMADALEIDLPTYWSWKEDLVALQPVSIHGRQGEKGDEEVSLEDVLADENAEDPQRNVEFDALREQLREALKSLGPRERLVLSLYYFEELKLAQIAEVLDVTESRVSQIRSKALKDLRKLISH